VPLTAAAAHGSRGRRSGQAGTTREVNGTSRQGVMWSSAREGRQPLDSPTASSYDQPSTITRTIRSVREDEPS
jgi:hypothetical protein